MSPKNKKGKVVTLYLIAVNSGIFCPIYPIIFLLFGIMAHDVFYPKKSTLAFLRGKAVQARQILSNIKNYSKQDFHDIQSNINYTTIKLTQINQNQRKLLWIGFGFFTQAVGINVIIYYAPTILIEFGIASHDSAIFYSIAIVLTVMLAAIYAGFNLDTIGRKNLL